MHVETRNRHGKLRTRGNILVRQGLLSSALNQRTCSREGAAWGLLGREGLTCLQVLRSGERGAAGVGGHGEAASRRPRGGSRPRESRKTLALRALRAAPSVLCSRHEKGREAPLEVRRWPSQANVQRHLHAQDSTRADSFRHPVHLGCRKKYHFGDPIVCN